MKSLTYGTLPSYEEFEKAFKDLCLGGIYVIEKYSCSFEYTCKELWDDIQNDITNWEDDWDHDLEEASCIMKTLGFEWI